MVGAAVDKTVPITPNGPTLEGVHLAAGQTAHMTFSAAWPAQHFMLHWTSHFPDDAATLTFPDGQAPQSGASGTAYHFDFSAPTAGPTEVAVSTTAGGTIDLSLVADVAYAIAPDGAAVTASTDRFGQNAVVTFTAAGGGQRYGVYWSSTYPTYGCCTGSRMTLDGGAGVWLDHASDWWEIGAPDAGTHTFNIDPTGADVGSVTLKLVTIPPDATKTLAADGGSVTIKTTKPGQNAVVTFTAAGGGQRYGVYWSSTYPTYGCCTGSRMTLDGGAGIWLDHASDWWEIGAPDAGTHTFFIDGHGTDTGSVTLKLVSIPPDATKTLAADGGSVTIKTTKPGQNAVVTFTAAGGGQRYGVYWSSTYPTYGCCTGSRMTLDGGAGVWLDHPSDWWEIGAPDAGTHTFFVDPHGTDTGSVTLRLVTIPADATATLTASGGPVTVKTTKPGQNADVSFTSSGHGAHFVLHYNSHYPTYGCCTGSRMTLDNGPGVWLDVGGTPLNWDLGLLGSGKHTLRIDPVSTDPGRIDLALAVSSGPLAGGRPIVVYPTGGTSPVGCTDGFGVLKDGPGGSTVPMMLTAQHCIDDFGGAPPFTVFSDVTPKGIQLSGSIPSCDPSSTSCATNGTTDEFDAMAWAPTAGTPVTHFYVSHDGAKHPIYGAVSAGGPGDRVGDLVCMFGGSSDRCGHIYQVDAQGHRWADVCSKPGDSGGPVVDGTGARALAAGIVTDTVYVSGQCNTLYLAISSVETKLGVSVLTSNAPAAPPSSQRAQF